MTRGNIHEREEENFQVLASLLANGKAEMQDLENYVEFFCWEPCFAIDVWYQAAERMQSFGGIQ